MTREDVQNDEKALVDELRRRMKGNMKKEMYEDYSVFQRFLRARNYDLDAAETMLVNHINWRRTFGVDTILTDYKPDEVCSQYMTLGRLGFDKDGCPVFLTQIGNLDTKGMLRSTNRKQVYLHIIEFLESNLAEMKKKSAKLGKPVEKWSYIINYENFSVSTAIHKQTLQIFSQLITLYDHNYPERLKNAYLINGSLGLTIAWAALKSFISGPTVKKIQIFGKDGWQSVLAENIGSEVLPGFLGGTLTDPDGDPSCRTIVKNGGIVPESYFLHRTSVCEEWMQNASKLVVSRISKAEVVLEVVYPESKIEWEFFVKNKDISFTLYYKGNGYSELEEVIPKQRIETDLSSEAGMILCKKSGKYVIQFDNRYSWMYSKEIYYTAKVVNTEKTEEEEQIHSL